MNDSNTHEVPKPQNAFEEFLLAEYNNISSAHFNTVSTISTFFRYYLLIVSIPISFLAVTATNIGTGKVKVFTQTIGPYIPWVSFLIACIGLCILAYVINLRLDAILYARTVNGIRKHFFNKSGLSFKEERRVRLLPRSIYKPSYFEGYFLPVVFAFSLFNSAYFGFGLCVLATRGVLFESDVWKATTIGAVTFFGANIWLYWWLAHKWSVSYLRSYILGVDIDGVLNLHREHFCDLLKEIQGKDLKPDQITNIPLRDYPNLGVTEVDELAIFNHPEYWCRMPACKEAITYLKRIKDDLNYEIQVFSYRPWPKLNKLPDEKKAKYEALWRKQGLFRLRKVKSVKKMTQDWLKEHSIPCDKLTVERKSILKLDPRSKQKDRFVSSMNRGFFIFVEDDLAKAKNLADICDMVFLIDQPYNQSQGPLPNNLKRVDSWRKIYEDVRSIF